MSDVEVVERPVRQGGRNINAELKAIIATAESGNAVRIALAGRQMKTLRSNFNLRVKQVGNYKLRSHIDGPDHLVVWVEKGPA